MLSTLLALIMCWIPVVPVALIASVPQMFLSACPSKTGVNAEYSWHTTWLPCSNGQPRFNVAGMMMMANEVRDWSKVMVIIALQHVCAENAMQPKAGLIA